MPASRVHDASFGFLEKAQLQKLRLRAMREGVWFRFLSMIDRVLVDLTIRVAGRGLSFTLAENVLAVARVQVLVGVRS